MQHEYCKIQIPEKYLSAMWLKHHGGEVHAMVMYSVDKEGRLSVDSITAVTSKHRAIIWCEAVYDLITEKAVEHWQLLVIRNNKIINLPV